MFDKIPKQYGRLVLKKGLIYEEYLKQTAEAREKRDEEARKRIALENEKYQKIRQQRIANGEPESSDDDSDFYADFY